MRVLILEDEAVAARQMGRLLREVVPGAQLQATLGSVEEAVRWLQIHPQPDLILMDVELSDGLSFEIAQHIPLTAPVILATAYDHYALRAFEMNSIDYILKPLDKIKLQRALGRLGERQPRKLDPVALGTLRAAVSACAPPPKSRFLSRLGKKLTAFDVEQVAYFIRDPLVMALTHTGRQLPLDRSLDDLQRCTDPQRFFRLNRRVLAAFEAITSIESYGKARLRVTLAPDSYGPQLVSEERAPHFRKWLGR